jgi:type II secretory pathway pseudopilin PulG
MKANTCDRWKSLPRPLPSREGGFTLIEIVLAIALTSVVMILLTTAIEMFMVRVDSSRNRVESAQLARTLLDRMAADLMATRLYAPSLGGGQGGSGGAGSGGGTSGQSPNGGQGAGGQNSGGASATAGGITGSGQNGAGSGAGQGSGGAASAGSAATSSAVQGVYGTKEMIRVDRSAYANWQRASRVIEAQEGAAAADVPISVRYYFAEGDRVSAQELAAQGVNVEGPRAKVGGLYREITPTATLAKQTDPLASTSQGDGTTVELLAPEVVKLEINYYDGKKILEVWDAYKNEGLPSGVEIVLTLYEPRLGAADEAQQRPSDTTYRADALVEYRRFVRLPYVSPAQPAEALLPAPAANGNGAGGRPGGNGGAQGNNGGAQAGGGNNGGQNRPQGGASGS